MKKTKLLLALCLAGSMGYAQSIITTVVGNGTQVLAAMVDKLQQQK